MVQDGARQDDVFRRKQNRWYVSEFEQRGLDHLEISGNILAATADALRDGNTRCQGEMRRRSPGALQARSRPAAQQQGRIQPHLP